MIPVLAYRMHPMRFSALPRAAFFSSARGRYSVSLLFIFVAIASAAAYVAGVNIMLVQGAEMKKLDREAAFYEDETGRLQDTAVRQTSPSFLEETARNAGLVQSSGVRYLRDDDTVAYAPLAR